MGHTDESHQSCGTREGNGARPHCSGSMTVGATSTPCLKPHYLCVAGNRPQAGMKNHYEYRGYSGIKFPGEAAGHRAGRWVPSAAANHPRGRPQPGLSCAGEGPTPRHGLPLPLLSLRGLGSSRAMLQLHGSQLNRSWGLITQAAVNSSDCTTGPSWRPWRRNSILHPSCTAGSPKGFSMDTLLTSFALTADAPCGSSFLPTSCSPYRMKEAPSMLFSLLRLLQ